MASMDTAPRAALAGYGGSQTRRQEGRPIPGTAERNALLAVDYRLGLSARELGSKYNLDPIYACSIGRKLAGPRKAPREGRRQNRITVYLSPREIFHVRKAAGARGITPGSLLSRLTRVLALDPSLFDNVLDDGVVTSVPQ